MNAEFGNHIKILPDKEDTLCSGRGVAMKVIKKQFCTFLT